MARTKGTTQESSSSRPFMTPEGEENYLISLAYSLVERRMKEGTASSQETTHFLNRGSQKARLEIERLEEENKLLRAKTEQIHAQAKSDEIYSKALTAFRRYSGQAVDEDYDY
jgi:uncharacterized protein (UPF0335 family)